MAAIELIHKQPVHWTHDRVVACDGGGGPAGHPRVFINTDKPEIAVCGYCGLPFVRYSARRELATRCAADHAVALAYPIIILMLMTSQAHEHHREHLQSLPETSYPLA
jgi:NADH dehydrogenase (ubiquinone) Fe-S protein 6